jgi:hypothetical protein
VFNYDDGDGGGGGQKLKNQPANSSDRYIEQPQISHATIQNHVVHDFGTPDLNSTTKSLESAVNPLTPELNPSAQRCLP